MKFHNDLWLATFQKKVQLYTDFKLSKSIKMSPCFRVRMGAFEEMSANLDKLEAIAKEVSAMTDVEMEEIDDPLIEKIKKKYNKDLEQKEENKLNLMQRYKVSVNK